jgi:hypothetical protein
MEKKEIALIGACDREWVDELLSRSEDGKRTIGIPWKGPVIARHQKEEKLLQEQLDSTGYFKLCFHLSKRLSGVGRIEYVAFVNDAKFFNKDTKTPSQRLHRGNIV